MLEIVVKGILIGLCISVPLGPIGMLCVQRTLNRGRLHGIFTGLGATTSDLIYTMIALYSLSYVTDIIEAHRFAIQLAGSILVIMFGYYIFRANPNTQPKPNEPKRTNLFSDYITSFILTFTNPLIIFVLLAMFARFEFVTKNSTPYLLFIGIFSILAGAFVWWSILTFVVGKFKNRTEHA